MLPSACASRSTTPWTFTPARRSSTARRTISATRTGGAGGYHRGRCQHPHAQSDHLRPGAIRCHPWLLREMEAVQIEDESALVEFDEALWGHIGHAVASSGAPAAQLEWRFRRRPCCPLAAHYRALNRYSASFAFCADMALVTLGGSPKRREMPSARFGDAVGLYLLRRAQAMARRGGTLGRPAAGQLHYGDGSYHPEGICRDFRQSANRPRPG